MRVFKYELEALTILHLPIGSKVLSVAEQDRSLMMWVLVSDSAETSVREFLVVGTGHDLPAGPFEFIGTVLMHDGRLVLHAFEALAGNL